MARKEIERARLTRRRWVGFATGAGFCLLAGDSIAASEFWKKKEPSAWTSDEVLQLATRSPWAVTARVLPRQGRDRGSFRAKDSDIGGEARAPGRNGGDGAVPVVEVAEVTVVWESAQPLLDTLKSTFPSDFASRYVIGVNDLPKVQGKHRVDQENMTASLSARGKGSVDAGAIEPLRNGSVVLFGFSKELLPLSSTDKDVVFTLETDQFSIRARFEPKEMMYKGKLAV